jgi:glycosyltransferase involved in cell wall biosynthesis
VLYLAEALSQWADVTVAFRRVLEPGAYQDFKVVEIDPAPVGTARSVDDAAIRGTGLAEFFAYLRSVRRFVEQYGNCYDIVLEKSWLLSGYLTALCQRRGLPAIVVENIVRVWHEPIVKPQDFLRYARYWFVRELVGYYLRRAPLIIAETEELKTAIVQQWFVPDECVAVAGLGVNRQLFRPFPQAEARRALNIAADTTVLLYVGVLDNTHNLGPVLTAMSQVPRPALELHIVGDGSLKSYYETLTASVRQHVIFHGRVPHTAVPQYIAAADLCIAPYDPQAFPNGKVAYSTLKIPEYMACARPVVSVPSGHILTLIRHGVSGFFVSNTTPDWIEFFRHCPPRSKLRQMGEAAIEMMPTCSWDETARAYLSLCEQTVMGRGRLTQLGALL